MTWKRWSTSCIMAKWMFRRSSFRIFWKRRKCWKSRGWPKCPIQCLWPSRTANHQIKPTRMHRTVALNRCGAVASHNNITSSKRYSIRHHISRSNSSPKDALQRPAQYRHQPIGENVCGRPQQVNEFEIEWNVYNGQFVWICVLILLVFYSRIWICINWAYIGGAQQHRRPSRYKYVSNRSVWWIGTNKFITKCE